MCGRMSQSDRAASKGLPATSELDASTTIYWNGGTPKASLDGGAARSRAAPASCAAHTRAPAAGSPDRRGAGGSGEDQRPPSARMPRLRRPAQRRQRARPPLSHTDARPTASFSPADLTLGTASAAAGTAVTVADRCRPRIQGMRHRIAGGNGVPGPVPPTRELMSNGCDTSGPWPARTACYGIFIRLQRRQLEAVLVPQRRGVPEHADDDGEHYPGNRQHPARQASCCRSCVTTRTPAFARGVPLAGSRPRSRPGLPRAVAGQRDARRLPWLRRQRQHPLMASSPLVATAAWMVPDPPPAPAVSVPKQPREAISAASMSGSSALRYPGSTFHARCSVVPLQDWRPRGIRTWRV